MCKCKNIDIGSYDNQIVAGVPVNVRGTKKQVCLDRCVADEVKNLWSKGIRTTGCCCGHNKVEGFIGVVFEDIPKMKALGYKVQHNPCRPNDEDSFVPKSVLSLKENNYE